MAFILYPLISLGVYADNSLTLGVYQNFYEKHEVKKTFSPLAQFLSQRTNQKIHLKVLNSNELITQVGNKQVDMLIVDPYHYLLLKTGNNIGGMLATLQTQYNNQKTDVMGGVIFTKFNSDITSLKNLAQHKIAIPSEKSTGAYLLPFNELRKQQVNTESLEFISYQSNKAVIESVINEETQLGFLKTGLLEDFINQGVINPGDIKIINQKPDNVFKHKRSTDLFPEWGFVFVSGADLQLQKRVVTSLYSPQLSHSNRLNQHIAGFTTPKDYLPYIQIFHELKLPPFETSTDEHTHDTWSLYLWQLIAFISVAALFLIFFLSSENLKNKLNSQGKHLIKQTNLNRALLDLAIVDKNITEDNWLCYALEKIEKITESHIGLIILCDKNSNNIKHYCWSKQTQNNHKGLIEDYPAFENAHIKTAGIWAKSGQIQLPVILNNLAIISKQEQLPRSHKVLKNMISVPVIEHGKIAMIIGVANKPDAYEDFDVEICQFFAHELWGLIKKHNSTLQNQSKRNRYEELLIDLSENTFVFSLDVLNNHVVQFISAGFKQVFEQPIDEILDKPWLEHLNWDDESKAIFRNGVEKLIKQELDEHQLTMTFTTVKGHRKLISVLLHGKFDNGKLVAIEGMAEDITVSLETENYLQQAAQVFEYANEGILITNKDNVILRANKRLEQISGYTESELIGKNPKILSSGQQDETFYGAMWSSLIERGYWEGDLLNRRKSGELFPCRSKISMVNNTRSDEPEYFIGLFSDITEERAYQSQLEKMAHYDALTGLPNRLLLSDRINQALSLSERSHEIVSLMFLDLDGFKEINDTFGHAAGDYLLKTVADKLSKIVRKQDTVARLGGDEFVVLISGNTDKHVFSRIEQDILTEIAKPIAYKSKKLRVSSSIGVVYHLPDSDKHYDPEQLLLMADQSMYQAKLHGKNQIQYFDLDNHEDKHEIQRALDQEQFVFYYQPKMDFTSGKVLALEALVRWNHPKKGMLAPNEFLDKIAQHNLMEALSIYVLKKTAAFIHTLQDSGLKFPVSINIHDYDLMRPQFGETLHTLFSAKNGLPPNLLILEILGNSAIENMEQISTKIEELKSDGFKIAIDDFGIGQTSLSDLKNLPVDFIKIDQTFIRDIFSDTSDINIIEAINSIAEAFNLKVIAEGLETDDHIELLLKLGVTYMQGYAISRPMNQDYTLEWLKNWHFEKKWNYIHELEKDERELLKAKIIYHGWIKQFNHLMRQSTDIRQINIAELNHNFERWLNSSIAQKTLGKANLKKLQKANSAIISLMDQSLESKINGDEQSLKMLTKKINEDNQVWTILSPKIKKSA